MREPRPSPSWHKAIFLHERTRLGAPPPLAEDSAARPDAERRAAAWRRLLGGDDALFAERLESAGWDRERLLALLASPEARGAPAPASWQDVLQSVVEHREDGAPLPAALETTPFLGFFQPFLRLGAARLRARIAALRARHPPEPPPGADVEAALLAELAQRLKLLAGRVLILELNVARMLGRLPGDTPEERFRYFSAAWFQDSPALPNLLEEYPVLARLLAVTVVRWVDACSEILERLAADRPRLTQALFGGRDPGALASVELGLSDLHRGGRGVARLRFGSGLKLVYKPKALGIERWFQQFLEWLNQEGLRHPHRALAVLEGDGYGWVELVEATACDGREAVQRFYWRQGSLLALLHLLSATDFHRENLIASGEHPVLVDLEALFHHRAPFDPGEAALGHALDLLGKSVLSVGLLPVSVFGQAGRAGVDISGLGGEAGQVIPQAVPRVEDAGQDTMRMVRVEARMEEANNRPRLGDAPVNASDFTEDIVQGFEETWALLMRRRAAVAEVLEGCAGVEVRHILRATRRYVVLLGESLHPDFLRDGLERDKVLDNLWAEAAERPALRRALPFEHADLLLGDIPMFTTRPGARHLWSSEGTCIPDFFERDSLSEARERLGSLDERGCAAQVSLIRQALLFLEKEKRPGSPGAQPRRAAAPAASPDECLAAAIALGDDLAKQAIHGREDVCWIGLSLESPASERWSLAPLQANLYDGLGGVALFYAHLAAQTGRRDFEALARAALVPVREAWSHPAPDDRTVGAFVGRASAAYVLGHLAALWGEPALWDEVLAGLPALEPLIDADTSLDLVSGSAGCAVALLGLYRRTGDARLLATARRCGERLRATALRREDGSVGWRGLGGTQPPLSGFSHGAAGYAWVLLELAAATGEASLRDLALRALRYERTLFVPEQRNWRDLRVFENVPPGPGFMMAWCHGAPGIALGRALSLRHLEDARLLAELELALEATRSAGGLGNHSLCHGDLGNLEVLHVAGEVLNEPRWRRAALGRAAGVLREGREGGWRCGLPKNHQTPGLMVGLAGIGFGLLRLAAPRRVPSVLSLAAPPAQPEQRAHVASGARRRSPVEAPPDTEPPAQSFPDL